MRTPGRPATPVAAGHDRGHQFEGADQLEQIMGERGLLARPHRRCIDEAGAAITTHIRHDDVSSGVRQHRRNLVVAARVVPDAVQQDDRPSKPIATALDGDLQHARTDS
jgi:hypothetical protein